MKWTYLLVIAGAAYMWRKSQTKRTMITVNFSLEELTKSRKAEELGIDNTPGPVEVAALYALAVNVLQPLRDYMNSPVKVNSGYRSPALNSVLNGAQGSQHMNGEAADVTTADNAAAFYYIRNHLPFDQLIWEKGTSAAPAWIHVSYKANGTNRGEVLRFENGVYTEFS